MQDGSSQYTVFANSRYCRSSSKGNIIDVLHFFFQLREYGVPISIAAG